MHGAVLHPFALILFYLDENWDDLFNCTDLAPVPMTLLQSKFCQQPLFMHIRLLQLLDQFRQSRRMLCCHWRLCCLGLHQGRRWQWRRSLHQKSFKLQQPALLAQAALLPIPGVKKPWICSDVCLHQCSFGGVIVEKQVWFSSLFLCDEQYFRKSFVVM
jgi:hypothetical protein